MSNMQNFNLNSRPVSTNQKNSKSIQNKKDKSKPKRPSSICGVKAQQLSALKQRIKQRNQNKQNNPLFKSQNITSAFIGAKSLVMPISRPLNNITKKLSIDDFQIGDLLGKGAQAKVRIAFHKATGSIFSIKTIIRQKIQKNIDTFIRSLKIQMYLDHPNIAKVYDLIVEQKHVHIIMQYCMEGDLSMNRELFGKQKKNIKTILYKISAGLQYLHSMRIQHRDLKLQNILLCCGVPKITDFQISVYTKLDFFPRKTICGSPAYFCPQMIQKQRYNKKADIWCLGIIFYEMLCGYFPFQMNKIQDLNNIVNKQIKQFPEFVSQKAVQLILKMLSKQSQSRFNIQQVIKHQFFQLVNEQKQKNQ